MICKESNNESIITLSSLSKYPPHEIQVTISGSVSYAIKKILLTIQNTNAEETLPALL